jgi:hypothetical protein
MKPKSSRLGGYRNVVFTASPQACDVVVQPRVAFYGAFPETTAAVAGFDADR